MEVEQRQIIKTLHNELSLKLTSLTKGRIQPGIIKTFCMKVLHLFRDKKVQDIMKNGVPIVLHVSLNKLEYNDSIFDSTFPNELSSLLNDGNVLKIDHSGILQKETIAVDLMNSEDAGDYSTSNIDDWIFMVEGDYLQVFSNGRIVKSLDIFNTKRSRSFVFKRPISEYKTLIDRHYEEEILKPKVDFWHNKGERVLRNRPENLFGTKLYAFLDAYVSDGHVEFEKSNAGTADRTDISVTTFDPKKVYILEVKWLGKSDGGSSYVTKNQSTTRANEGIQQLHEYIRKEPHCAKGILVIYDARKDQIEIEWLDKEKWRIEIEENPFLLYLQSLSASKTSEMTVKSLKQKRNSAK